MNGSCETNKRSPIQESLDNLENEINLLGTTIGELEKKLDPIILSVPMGESATEQPNRERCFIDSILEAKTTKIYIHRIAIERIIRCLQI